MSLNTHEMRWLWCLGKSERKSCLILIGNQKKTIRLHRVLTSWKQITPKKERKERNWRLSTTNTLRCAKSIHLILFKYNLQINWIAVQTSNTWFNWRSSTTKYYQKLTNNILYWMFVCYRYFFWHSTIFVSHIEYLPICCAIQFIFNQLAVNYFIFI